MESEQEEYLRAMHELEAQIKSGLEVTLRLDGNGFRVSQPEGSSRQYVFFLSVILGRASGEILAREHEKLNIPENIHRAILSAHADKGMMMDLGPEFAMPKDLIKMVQDVKDDLGLPGESAGH